MMPFGPAMGLRNSMYMMELPTQTNASTNRNLRGICDNETRM